MDYEVYDTIIKEFCGNNRLSEFLWAKSIPNKIKKLLQILDSLMSNSEWNPNSISDYNNEELCTMICEIEQACLKKLIDANQKAKLIDNLKNLAMYAEQNSPINKYEFNSYHYQVAWCAQWCIDNVLATDNPIEKLPMLKMSSDRLSVRNNSEHTVPVRSSFQVESDNYYYEVTIVTDGEMRFGWSRRETLFHKTYNIGDDGNSIGFDPSEICIYFAGNKYNGSDQIESKISQYYDCDPGDVIGCQIFKSPKMNENSFAFFYNGKFAPFERIKNDEHKIMMYKKLSYSNIKEKLSRQLYPDKRYRNLKNRSLELLDGEMHSDSPYYATASLSPGQQCHFNFGQAPFKYPPKDFKFKCFYETDPQNCHLMETCFMEDQGIYWFKNENDSVSLYYDDSIQRYIDTFVEKIIQNNQFDQIIAELSTHCERKHIRSKNNSVRYIQSIIEIMRNLIEDDKVDVMALWILRVIKEASRGENFHIDNYIIEDRDDYDDIIFYIDQEMMQAPLELFYSERELLEMLHRHMRFRITTPSEVHKCRIICIVLCNLFKFRKIEFEKSEFEKSKLKTSDFEKSELYSQLALDFDQPLKSTKPNTIENLRREVFNFFTRNIIESRDEWTILFAINGIENMQLVKKEIETLKQHDVILHLQNMLKNVHKKDEFFELLSSRCRERINCQFKLCAQNFLANMLQSSSIYKVCNPGFATMNSKDKTQQLKLSSDLLSARSDCRYQSILSVGYVKSNIYHYEVVLLTSGPMRIGWATKRTKILQTKKGYNKNYKIGDDQFSIGIDGYSRLLYHDGQRHQLTNMSCQWKAGDIVGCLLETTLTGKQFFFYLNGQPITYRANIYSSWQPYHASVSLAPFQQCYFNFGQKPFRAAPKRVDYGDFKTQEHYSQKISRIWVDMNNASINNSLLTIGDSDNSMGNITFSQVIQNQNSLASKFESNHESINVSPKRPLTECRRCSEQSPTKLLRFNCCPKHDPLCLECLSQMQHCLKCVKRNLSNTQIGSTSTNECRLCTEENPTKLLRFECCDNGPLCLECLKTEAECPKCRNKISKC